MVSVLAHSSLKRSSTPAPSDAPARFSWAERVFVIATVAVLTILGACADDGPAPAASPVIDVDVFEEARDHNGGSVFEFVANEDGYVRTPAALPAGDVMLTLTYTGVTPAPHSLVIEGLNGDQPVVAVDLPGSNNGTVVIPSGGYVFYDGAPGNRAAGFEGRIHVEEVSDPTSPTEPNTVVSWSTEGLAFTSAPRASAPAGVPIALQLTVADELPHSIALERVRGEQPLVAVDGPGTNRRTIALPPGTYTYFCAVPGHRQAGMEGELDVG